MPTPLRALMQGPLPVTAPLVLNPLMARMVETAGFPAGYLGGGATGYQKVALEANLFGVYRFISLKIIQRTARAPCPGPE